MDDTFIKESIKKEKKNIYCQIFIKYLFIFIIEVYMIWKYKLVWFINIEI